MKMKKEMIILIGVIVVLTLYLVFHNSDRTQYQLPAIAELNKKDISKVEIESTEKDIVLTRKDDKWVIEPKGYPGDSNTIDRMLDILDDLTVTALASEAESYQRYDLGDEKKIRVKAWAGDHLEREFDIGRAVPTFQHTFIHLTDDPNVYHARGNFRDTFEKTVESLRDKTVLSFEKSQIQHISLTKENQIRMFQLISLPVDPGKNLSESMEASEVPEMKMEWQTTDGEKADETAIDGLLGTLTRLKCDRYHEDENKDDFQNAAYMIELKGVANVLLSIFNQPDSETSFYPAISSYNDYPFYLSDTQGKSIIEKVDAFFESIENK